MGYSHYWYRPFGHEDRDAFRRLGTDALAIIRKASALGVEVAGWNGLGAPEFTEVSFSLNGSGDDACETFAWQSRAYGWHDGDEVVFDCCKTRRNDYDAVVCAILIRAKVIYGDAVRVSSDGEWSDEWREGRALYSHTFGESAPCPFSAVNA